MEYHGVLLTAEQEQVVNYLKDNGVVLPSMVLDQFELTAISHVFNVHDHSAMLCFRLYHSKNCFGEWSKLGDLQDKIQAILEYGSLTDWVDVHTSDEFGYSLTDVNRFALRDIWILDLLSHNGVTLSSVREYKPITQHTMLERWQQRVLQLLRLRN